MKFEHLIIKNFRNFEEIAINLTNKNIIFGLNDIGKTNFLAALRFLLDKSYRRANFIESDFYNRDTARTIEITVKINISDFTNDDNKKIRTMMRGAIPSSSSSIFIQVKSTYNADTLIGEPLLFWGTDISHLEAVPSYQSQFELDKYFNVVYIDSSIQLEGTFKRYAKEIFKQESSITAVEKQKLGKSIDDFNSSISKLSSIKKFETELVKEYENFRKEKHFKVAIESEIELSNIYSKLTPYIQDEKCMNYPTSGDGRRKLLAYTLLTLENRKHEEKKINIFLIEELENHLHRSMQVALSYQLFSEDVFRHLFMTTHSSLIVSQMDKVNLIKLYKTCGIVGKSHVYEVPVEYQKMKQKLNQNLAEAIFADYVLLVEGPSEKVLFNRILFDKFPKYESFGGYMLEVDGINFKDYYKVLKALGIQVIVKTDNDLQKVKAQDKYHLSGVNRCFSIVNVNKKVAVSCLDFNRYEKDSAYTVQIKKEYYDKLKRVVSRFKRDMIYLSRVDLENDLYDVIPGVMKQLATDNGSKKSAVDYLQTAKLVNMIELCGGMSSYSVNKIYNHPHFECIRKLVELCAQ